MDPFWDERFLHEGKIGVTLLAEPWRMQSNSSKKPGCVRSLYRAPDTVATPGCLPGQVSLLYPRERGGLNILNLYARVTSGNHVVFLLNSDRLFLQNSKNSQDFSLFLFPGTKGSVKKNP
jgi:hypothetical protein